MASWIAVALWIVLGGLAAIGARSRGRSPVAWFFLGSLLGWWGLLLLYLLPPVFSEEVPPPVAQVVLPVEKPRFPVEQSKDWFFIDQAKTVCGPLSGKDLKEKWSAGQLNASSWVWNENITEWKKISQVQDLTEWLHSL